MTEEKKQMFDNPESTKRTLQESLAMKDDIVQQGLICEQERKIEEAFTYYKEAADAGNPFAMFAIGNLYINHLYDGLPDLNALQMPHSPWNKPKLIPNLKEGFAWYLRAAQSGLPDAMYAVGSMLHLGQGCLRNDEEAKHWLKMGAEQGNVPCGKALKDFFNIQMLGEMDDATYDETLEKFCRSVEESSISQAKLFYDQLLAGTDKQLCRLGYRIAVGIYNISECYKLFSIPNKSNGHPCAPVYCIRPGWITFLHVNADAFPEEHPIISFATDIFNTAYPIIGAVGTPRTKRYHAENYSWLKGEREADLFIIDPEAPSGMKSIMYGETIEEALTSHLYWRGDIYKYIKQEVDENQAFLVEPGEKEYSVEIGHVVGDKVLIIMRYTIY